MASAKQIAWRKKFAKLYGKKKTGSKSKVKAKKSSKELQAKLEARVKREGGVGVYGDKNQKRDERELNAILRARMRETKDPVVKKALRSLMF
mgnify:CR=1 FL=1